MVVGLREAAASAPVSTVPMVKMGAAQSAKEVGMVMLSL